MTKAIKREAQLVIVTGMLVLYFIFHSNRYFDSAWFLYIGTFVGVGSIFIPALGDLIVKGWFKIAEVLGAINGKILLSIVFYIVLFPVAMLAKMGKKNPLQLRKESGSSVFQERNHTYTPSDLDKVW